MLIKIGDAWVDPAEIAMITTDRSGIRFVSAPDAEQICIQLRHGACTWVSSATMDEAEAALIDAGYIENPYPEEDEPPELTDGELETLADLHNRAFEYLARDKDGKLYAFRNKPEKDGAYWNTYDNDKAERIDEGFDFVAYEDEKPWSIAWLLVGP